MNGIIWNHKVCIIKCLTITHRDLVVPKET